MPIKEYAQTQANCTLMGQTLFDLLTGLNVCAMRTVARSAAEAPGALTGPCTFQEKKLSLCRARRFISAKPSSTCRQPSLRGLIVDQFVSWRHLRVKAWAFGATLRLS